VKVLYLLNGFPKASETFITDEISGLVDRGVDVRVLALEHGNSRLDQDVARKVCGRITYASDRSLFATIRAMIRLILGVGHTRQGKRVARLLFFRAKRMFYQSALLSASLADSESDFDVCVSHFASMGVVVAVARDEGYLSSTTHVNVSHGSDLSALPRRLSEEPFIFLFSQSQTVAVTIARSWLPLLKDLGVQNPIHRYLGVDPDRFPFRQRLLPEGRPIRLLTVGRLVEKKGHLVTLEALASLPDSFDWQYEIVGEGPLRDQVVAAAKDLSIADRVVFHGQQAPDRVSQLMSESDVFILASHTAENGDCEGLPVSLMEAMASGLPVISTRHSGIPELVIDGETGLLAEQADVDSLAEKISALFSTADLWERVTAKGKSMVDTQFSAAKNLEEFLGFLRDISKPEAV